MEGRHVWGSESSVPTICHKECFILLVQTLFVKKKSRSTLKHPCRWLQCWGQNGSFIGLTSWPEEEEISDWHSIETDYLIWFPWIFPKQSIFILLGLQEIRPPNWRRMSLSHFPHLYTVARLEKWPRAGSGLVSVKAKISLQYKRLWILSFLSWRPSTSELEKRFASLDTRKS
jgi:hypothetical protein